MGKAGDIHTLASAARDAGWADDPTPYAIDGVPDADELIATMRSYLPDGDFDLLRRAYDFAGRAHALQFRKSGEPYFAHPVAVAFLLCRLRLDVASVCAGLLHDVAEDTEVTVVELARRFSPEIAAIVDGVTKLDQIKFSSQQHKQAENFRKMLVAMSRDIRVLLIKLADRLHNMGTLQHMKPESQRRIALETQEIYAPLANRLGIGWMKAQLEDLCFRHLHTEEYRRLAETVGQRQTERQAYVADVVQELRELMDAEGLSHAMIYGRPKHLFGIWKKMENGKVPYEQIYDAQGFRIMVNDIKECYQALGAVHTHYKPIPGRFKDYIALPKANRYQSLHTSVIGPRAERIEVQIRTSEMHRLAEEGVAAHWKYKEKGESLSLRDEERFAWLKQLLEWHTGVKDSDEFLETMKVDLFNDEVYTFTPQGDVKVLPRGATPIDFAYAVHSKIGERCVGAKVDGAMVPLRHTLRNGNIVEILTRADAHPSQDWLEFAVTARAKNRIRTYIHAEQRARALEIGTDLLEKALRRVRCSLARAQAHDRLGEALGHFGLSSWEELAVAVGFGKADPDKVARLLFPDAQAPEPEKIETPKRPRRQKKGAATVVVDGLDDVLVRFGKCCSPVPGDAIVGVVTRGRGITVHQRGCPRVLEADALRRLDCEWNTSSGTAATVTVRVYTENAAGLLAAMSQRFTESGIDIQSAHCRVIDGRRAVNDFEVVVHNVGQLNSVIGALSRLGGVTRVERVRG
jgi:guanosine-3',5'-bis(diphosphate) 3'-pyrophosphohydrolase